MIKIDPMATLDGLKEAFCVQNTISTAKLVIQPKVKLREVYAELESDFIEEFSLQPFSENVHLEVDDVSFLTYRISAAHTEEGHFEDAICWAFQWMEENECYLEGVL